MPGRNRSTKALAQRIDRQYFRRVFPLQYWRWILSIASVALGLLWIGLHWASHSRTVYNTGPLTPAHAMLNQKCQVCHVRAGAFTASVTDQACSACHNGAIHQANQTFTPPCADCHAEHSATRLTAVSDRQCVACHGDLKTKTGKLKVAAAIHSFTGGHPEFATQRAGLKDPGTIKFNHAVHLRKDLRGSSGNVTLVCSDCHRTGNTEPWPYGTAVAASSGGRKYMAPVNYYEHCSACHPLMFDRRINEPVPHKDPDIVHDFLTRKFTAWIAAHPEELRAATRTEIRMPGTQPPAPPRDAAAWIAARVDQAELLLRVKTCKECHDIAPSDRGIPPIAKANLTPRWFKDAEFDHSAHQMLVCESCHAQAARSTKTSDVLLPGISVCRECHVPGKTDAANSSCVECHIYHDPAKHRHVEGKFTADQISALRQ